MYMSCHVNSLSPFFFNTQNVYVSYLFSALLLAFNMISKWPMLNSLQNAHYDSYSSGVYTSDWGSSQVDLWTGIEPRHVQRSVERRLLPKTCFLMRCGDSGLSFSCMQWRVCAFQASLTNQRKTAKDKGKQSPPSIHATLMLKACFWIGTACSCLMYSVILWSLWIALKWLPNVITSWFGWGCLWVACSHMPQTLCFPFRQHYIKVPYTYTSLPTVGLYCNTA